MPDDSQKVVALMQRMVAAQRARSALREDAAVQPGISVAKSEPPREKQGDSEGEENLPANRRVIKVTNHEKKRVKKAVQGQLRSPSKIQKETISAEQSEDWFSKSRFYPRTYSKERIIDPAPWIRVELELNHIDGGRD